MAALGGADHWGVADQGVVDSGVRNQVGLELVQVDVQGTVESQRTRNRAHHLSNQTVEVLEGRAGDIKVTAADIIDGFIVNEESAVRVLNGAVGRENCIVRLNNGGGDTGSRVDGEFELGLLAIVGAQALEQERAEAGSSSTTEGVEDQETLEAGAVVLFAPCWLAHQSSHLRCPQAHRILLGRSDFNAPGHVGSYPGSHPRSPCQWCSDHAHSCWRRPPCH